MQHNKPTLFNPERLYHYASQLGITMLIFTAILALCSIILASFTHSSFTWMVFPIWQLCAIGAAITGSLCIMVGGCAYLLETTKRQQ